MVASYRALLRSDFESVREYLTSINRWPSTIDATAEGFLRRVHHLSYSMMLWSDRIIDLPKRGQVFLDELRAESLQILPHCIDGYAKTPLLLMRCCVESAVKHAYFVDHQIEFERHGQDAFTLNATDGFDYLRKHPFLNTVCATWKCVDRLSSSYGQLSQHIHGTRSFQEAPLRLLGEIEMSSDVLLSQLKVLENVTASINFLIAVIQRHRLSEFDEDYRAILLRTMPKEARASLTGISLV